MGTKQSEFLAEFRAAFRDSFGDTFEWTGGQGQANTAQFKAIRSGRRNNVYHAAERFELGDLVTSFRGHRLIIEFESKQIPVSNLLKYWPYLRGELSLAPSAPLIICHFSDWWSYGINRDLWQWTLLQMQQDKLCAVSIAGIQLDHGGADVSMRRKSIVDALSWLSAEVQEA